ncbi:MAG: hypothetical protein FWH56_02220 [Betaproteobacteria bacterium]|nr:hypothetical protein [Betaproteobacteria bacterium]
MSNDEIDLGIGGSLEKIKTETVSVLDSSESPSSLAGELGYEGSLAVDVLEERIRFYQRRTVEDAIELGKYLLLLKAVTPHGEFEGRIEHLGFTPRTARNFMRSAARVYKSETVSLLAKRVKGIKGFLEMLTLEDDDIQNILELDDLDRMSASQLRALARKLREEKDTAQTRLNTAETRIERLQRGISATDPDMPKETVIARAYCMGAMKTAELKLEGLFRNFAQEASGETEDARLRLEQEWVAANAIAARALDVIARMRELAPFELPPRIMGQHILTPEEAERWLIDSRMLENADGVEEASLHEPAPERRGRGRPRKEA